MEQNDIREFNKYNISWTWNVREKYIWDVPEEHFRHRKRLRPRWPGLWRCCPWCWASPVWWSERVAEISGAAPLVSCDWASRKRRDWDRPSSCRPSDRRRRRSVWLAGPRRVRRRKSREDWKDWAGSSRGWMLGRWPRASCASCSAGRMVDGQHRGNGDEDGRRWKRGQRRL